MITLVAILSFLATFFISAIGQDDTVYYYIYWPDEANFLHFIQMSFNEDNTRFVVNIHIEGDHWAALGFADSGQNLGFMEGVDAWVFGDFGGSSYEVIEFALDDHGIGTQDAQQNLLEVGMYSIGDATEVHIERLLDTGNRDDYVIVEGGTLCILYAFGVSFQVETGHNSTTRGMECFEVTGTTQPPTGTPSYEPTPAPTNSPTAKPTKNPTVAGESAQPTPDPTPRPTDEPTTSEPTLSPTNKITGVPSRPPTPSPTRPPTIDINAPTPSPSDPPSPAPTLTFCDDCDDTGEDEEGTEKDSSDAFEVWTWLIIGLLSLLVVCLLGAICFCYERNRRIRKKRNEEKEKAYEELENYRAKHGLDIPESAPKVADMEEDEEEDATEKGGVGNIAKAGKIQSDESSSDGSGDAALPAYAPPTAGGKKDRGPKQSRKSAKYRQGKQLGVNGLDDDSEVLLGMDVTPQGKDDAILKPQPRASSKFVDPNQARRDRIRREREKRISARQKLSQQQASESANSPKKSPKQEKDGGNDEEEDNYDYEEARREREERRRRRQMRRQSSKKKGKFGVFDENNW